MKCKEVIKIVLVLLFCVATKTHAATKFEVSGWIPYWRTATGTAEVLVHLDSFTEINPFGYTVTSNGKLYDNLHLQEEPWKSVVAAAKEKKIRVVPTVMWGNGQAIHKVLSNKALRDALIKDIVNMVKTNKVDGVDIDFEAKLVETKEYFSLFLKDLYKAMGNKWVQCDIESRTPVGSRYDNVPADFNPNDVANDYKALNKYCDRVRIMAYDQARVDLKLNRANPGLYAPVSDVEWAEKLINIASIEISPKKLVLGIPTYGYEYQVAPGGIGGYTYKELWAFNPRYSTDLAKNLNIIPQRNSAGELSFIYYPTSSSTPNEVRGDIQTNFVSWSDAQAIQEKVALAKRRGIRGVAIFKIDGGADPLMWSILK
jgi:spore germination protein